MRLDLLYLIFGGFMTLTLGQSCKNDYSDLKEGTTDHGYHFFWARNEKTPVVKPGEVLFFNAELYVGGVLERRSQDLGRTMKKLLEPKDSLLVGTKKVPIDQFFPIAEVFYYVSKGDSIIIDKTGMYKPEDSLKTKEITWKLSILDIKPLKVVEEAEKKRLEKLEKDKEIWEGTRRAVETNFGLYLKDIEEGNKLGYTSYTKSNVKVVILKPGNGLKPVLGEKVRFHYYAHHAKLGLVEESYSRGIPEKIIVGAFALNIGIEEGLLEIPKGSKAMVFIPAKIANISSKIPSAIPEGTNLEIFIDLLEDEPEY
ncbi:MAG: FKBP-type peptidyl-prolyl cis-trans isomerase [Saprospiraceae bacterium]|jgi:FKBP-type peptidyl-prolyl cis-trans isomerase|nr:FKBP-type peptidyl-prolyl cis-trans isomerase [Saprospiraceae bacterium]